MTRPPSTLSRDGCIDENRRLEAEVESLTTERDEANAWNQRCRDMVRHCRGRLFMDELLDEVEYVALCNDHGAAGRLEDYSDIRRERDEARQAAAVEAKLGDEARAEVESLAKEHRQMEALLALSRETVEVLEADLAEARAEVERLRSDLAAIWTTCTGIVSTAADGPDADNIPRRVEELRERAEELFEALARWGTWAHSPEGAGELFEAAVEGTPAECFPVDAGEAPDA